MRAGLSIRSIAMPIAIVLGALFCREVAWVDSATDGWMTPSFIFIMLFFTFCKVDVRKVRLSMLHLWLILFQIIGSLAIYYALAWADVVVAQGAMICVLAPVAMAAVIIGAMLDADLESMVAYSLLCNVVMAFLAPVYLHAFGNGECTMWQILQKVAPLLLSPFIAGQLCRLLLPSVAGWVSRNGQISFYVWVVSLTVIIGRTTSYLLDNNQGGRIEAILAVVSAVLCFVQFVIGHRMGRRYGEPEAASQLLGQKNTILVVWMSQTFLNPISSVAPTAYIVWQNIANSYQIYSHDKAKKNNGKEDRKD